MKTDEPKQENCCGLLQTLRRVLGKLFCNNAEKGQCLSDEDIRNSISGKSATSTQQKPDLDERP